MFPKFNSRNAIPAVFYSIATALEFWHIMTKFAAELPDVAPDATAMTLSTFLVNTVVAAIFFNLLDSHGVGFFRVFESSLYNTRRSILIALVAMSASLGVGWLAALACNCLEMNSVEIFFEMTVAELIAFWSLSLLMRALGTATFKTSD